MSLLQTEITIHASAEKVWSILTDFEKYPEWNPLILSISGKQEKGARLRVALNNGKGSSVFKPEVVAFEINGRFEWRGHLPLGMFTGHHQFHIQKISEHETKFIHREDFSGWLSGVIMKQIGEGTRKGFIKMNEALKQRAEV